MTQEREPFTFQGVFRFGGGSAVLDRSRRATPCLISLVVLRAGRHAGACARRSSACATASAPQWATPTRTRPISSKTPAAVIKVEMIEAVDVHLAAVRAGVRRSPDAELFVEEKVALDLRRPTRRMRRHARRSCLLAEPQACATVRLQARRWRFRFGGEQRAGEVLHCRAHVRASRLGARRAGGFHRPAARSRRRRIGRDQSWTMDPVEFGLLRRAERGDCSGQDARRAAQGRGCLLVQRRRRLHRCASSRGLQAAKLEFQSVTLSSTRRRCCRCRAICRSLSCRAS